MKNWGVSLIVPIIPWQQPGLQSKTVPIFNANVVNLLYLCHIINTIFFSFSKSPRCSFEHCIKLWKTILSECWQSEFRIVFQLMSLFENFQQKPLYVSFDICKRYWSNLITYKTSDDQFNLMLFSNNKLFNERIIDTNIHERNIWLQISRKASVETSRVLSIYDTRIEYNTTYICLFHKSSVFANLILRGIIIKYKISSWIVLK